MCREPWRFVPVPGNVVAKHRGLARAARSLRPLGGDRAVSSDFGDGGDWEFCAAGFAAAKLADVLGEEPQERLSRVPAGPAAPAAGQCAGPVAVASCREVLVVEETEPFVETALHAIAHARRPGVRILGKLSGHLRPEGELFRWQIQEALLAWQPGLELAGSYRPRG